MKLPPDDTLAAAIALLGEPNWKLSDGTKLRWRNKGALSLDLQRGLWFDHEAGVGGDIVDLVRHAGAASNFVEASNWLVACGWIGAAPTQHLQRDNSNRQRTSADGGRPRAIEILRETQPVAGTLAETYLLARAINPPWPDAIRFHPRLWCVEVGQHLPAMVCAISPLDAPDRPHAVQRIWLAADGRKANLRAPKKTLGALAGGGVVLAPFHSRLIVAEGVETALSVDEVWGTSAVATLGTANMEAVQIPVSVSDVLIAFDCDTNGAGEKAARNLATRLHAEGRAVTLIPPPASFSDWNEHAQASGGEARHG